MRKLVLGLVIAGTCGLGGAAIATAAPITVAPLASGDALMQPAHCRKWLPHRHSGAKPHGFGFGCSKTARAKRAKRS